MSSTLATTPESGRSRATSALIAAAVSAVPVGLLLPLSLLPLLGGINVGWAVGVGAMGAAAAAAVGGVLGWHLAERVLVPRAPSRWLVLGVATLAVIAVATLVAGFMGIGSDSRVPPGALQPEPLARAFAYGFAVVAAWSVIAFLYGLFLLGLPSLIVAAGLVWLWVRVVRRLVRQRVAISGHSRTGPLRVPMAWNRASVAGGVAVCVVAVMAGAEAGARAASNDPPGILHGALIAWLLAFVGPALVAAAGIRSGRRTLVAAGAAGLACLLPFALTPVGSAGFIACALGLAIVAARMPPEPGVQALILSLVIAAFLSGSPAVLVVSTETVCWDAYADWGLTMRIWPDEPNGPSEVHVLSSGCNDASYSAAGAAAATYVSAAAVVGAVARARQQGGAVRPWQVDFGCCWRSPGWCKPVHHRPPSANQPPGHSPAVGSAATPFEPRPGRPTARCLA